MIRSTSRFALGATIALALAATGCLRGAVLDARIAEAKASAEALETLGDTEIARAGTEAQLAELEGLYRLAPHDDELLFVLVRAWTVYGAQFLQDARESAEAAGNAEAVAALDLRERHALERAAGFGLFALEKKGGPLDEARRTREGFARWCEERLTSESDGKTAYFTGRAWLLRARRGKGDPLARPFEAYVGTVLLERARKLVPGYAHYGAETLLAGAQAESKEGLEDARRSFDLLLEKTQKKALVVPLEYALRVACPTGDMLLYERLLNDVLSSADPGLEERLANVFAKRRARRALAPEAMRACKAVPKP